MLAGSAQLMNSVGKFLMQIIECLHCAFSLLLQNACSSHLSGGLVGFEVRGFRHV